MTSMAYPFDPPRPRLALGPQQEAAVAAIAERFHEAGRPLALLLEGSEGPLWTALLLGASWARDRLCADDALFEALAVPGALGAPVEAASLEGLWAPFADALPRAAGAALEGPRGLADAPLGRALRRFRQAVMLRIIAQDFAGLRTLVQTTEALSALADFCLEQALAGAEARLSGLWGRPVNGDGAPQRIAILALGKLGERALNLSSDIDLMAV